MPLIEILESNLLAGASINSYFQTHIDSLMDGLLEIDSLKEIKLIDTVISKTKVI
jgi:hypothetical protein